MSSRAMASQKNKRTSPFTNGVQTSQPPQPQKNTMSSSQRMSQLQGTMPRQNMPTSSRFSSNQNSSFAEPYASQPPPPPVQRNYERENTRRELSIPEAFAMLNQKITNIEEILSENGVQFESHTSSSINKDELIGNIQRELDGTIANLKFVQDNYNNLFADVSYMKTMLSEKDEILKNHSDSILKLEEQINNYLKTSEESVGVNSENDNEEMSESKDNSVIGEEELLEPKDDILEDTNNDVNNDLDDLKLAEEKINEDTIEDNIGIEVKEK